ncbi:MAG: PIG-L family deacetylase [Nakamurella sp.]
MAHPDDPEYGVAAAVAVWTAAGKDVRYVLATRGEAGIAGLPPAECAVEREQEQRRAITHVGVRQLEFLDHPDGRLEYGVPLRRDLAAAIRRHRPELVVTMNFGDIWFPGAWNSADHRSLGRAVVDAVGDAANEWIFPDLNADGLAPWSGVRWTAINQFGGDRHVDVGEGIEAAVASLAEHRRYLAALDSAPVLDQARAQVFRATGGPDADPPRVYFTVYG